MAMGEAGPADGRRIGDQHKKPTGGPTRDDPDNPRGAVRLEHRGAFRHPDGRDAADPRPMSTLTYVQPTYTLDGECPRPLPIPNVSRERSHRASRHEPDRDPADEADERRPSRHRGHRRLGRTDHPPEPGGRARPGRTLELHCLSPPLPRLHEPGQVGRRGYLGITGAEPASAGTAPRPARREGSPGTISSDANLLAFPA